ncbi:MAG: Gfo/Idh/MocA family oxidoreductase [Verrucomicrobia bacterium]|nr:Gfo/Idh/MocA family oxidoreductase [Verrucomicrobiota bacterium]
MKNQLSSSNSSPEPTTRREFLAQGGKIAAGAALAGIVIPHVHAAEDNTIRLALIGSGGRGSGAVRDAFAAKGGPVKLVAMADLFENRLLTAHKNLFGYFGDRIDVPPERRFIGFDAFKQAIDCLQPGRDVAMLTGYAGFRPAQLEYAVQKGVNVFMEKSFASDPVGVRRVIKAGEEAEKKGVKIAAGLQCRHSRNRLELIRRIRDGQLGDIHLIRAYRMEPSGPLRPRPAATKELEWQLRNFTKFLWVSGGLWAEMDIHQVDEICWLTDQWPVNAHGVGGRAANSLDLSQNLDSFSVEWTFPDGAKGYDVVRYVPKCHNDFVTYVHGTKCAAQFSGKVHAGTVRIFKDQRCEYDNIAWEAPAEELTPWQAEWQVLLDAIREDRPHNEAKRAAYANLADIMGRAAVHMGRIITWDEAMASNFQWCPDIDRLTFDSPPPVTADAQGRYPVPVPGIWKEI